ncbi:hypothetical protein [Neobacillus notoginsengisoli]|nr:hypothetical protein [Neobacillus notoginsengisoli]
MLHSGVERSRGTVLLLHSGVEVFLVQSDRAKWGLSDAVRL